MNDAIKNLTACKDRNFLIFNNGQREIYFDLADNLFKRTLVTGEKKVLANTGVKSFFRGIRPLDVPRAFSGDSVYQAIIDRMVRKEKFRENANFGSIFAKVEKYMHLESYLLLNIKVADYASVSKPVSIYSKPVIRFMRESGFEFNSTWEEMYNLYPKLITDLCTYVMDNHHDNLLIYKHMYHLVLNSNIFHKVALLVQPINVMPNSNYYLRDEYGFGAEYKALFDYVVKCIAVEAMQPSDVIDEYYDYLKMARKIKQLKYIARLREQGDTNTTLAQIGFVDYRKIEKYPKGLTIRHRIVTRNFNVMKQNYDEAKFHAMVNQDYAWEDDQYCVVAPNKSDDIKNEGTELNHCVGSYIESVLDGRTQICFMRKKDAPEQSLITLEIRSRGIQQARGYSNRDLSDAEKQWLEIYAKAKNLTYGSVTSDEDKVCPTLTRKKKDSVAETEKELCEAA